MPLTLHIINDGSGDAYDAAYDWTLWLVPHGNLNEQRVIAKGHIAGHRRGAGWRQLLRQIAEGPADEND